MKLIDSNLLIRFLFNDVPAQSTLVKKLLKSSSELLILTDVVFAEVIWVLTSFYKLPKAEVTNKLLDILTIESIQANKNLLYRALIKYQDNNIDYIDGYLAAFCEVGEHEGIYSFDEDFDKLKTIKRLIP